MNAPVNDPVNLGNPREMTLLELAKRVLEGQRVAGARSCSPRCPPTTPRCASPTSARPARLLGWEPDGGRRGRPAPDPRLVPPAARAGRRHDEGSSSPAARGSSARTWSTRSWTAGHEVAVVDNLATGERGVGQLRGAAPRGRPPERAARRGVRGGAAGGGGPPRRAGRGVRARSPTPPSTPASTCMGGLNLLECCRRAGVRRIIYSSSGGAGYGDTDVIPTPEEHPSLPASPYGDHQGRDGALRRRRGRRSTASVRCRSATPTSTGPRQNPQGEAGVVAIFCHRLLTGQPPIINGDGEQTRDYVYVEDVAAANVRALERPEVDRAGSTSAPASRPSVNDLYGRLRRAPPACASRPQRGPARPGEQRRSCLDPGRAGRRLGWARGVARRGPGPHLRVLQAGRTGDVGARADIAILRHAVDISIVNRKRSSRP